MSNIKQVFRVEMPLGENTYQSFSTLFDNVVDALDLSMGIEFGSHNWRLCSWSQRLICEEELNTLEEAQKVESLGFEFLEYYGYFLDLEEE